MQQQLMIYAASVAFSAGLLVGPATAQTKPMHSGHLSHGAPQMRVKGSGLHRPNRPHYHHHYGHPGYRAPISSHHK